MLVDDDVDRGDVVGVKLTPNDPATGDDDQAERRQSSDRPEDREEQGDCDRQHADPEEDPELPAPAQRARVPMGVVNVCRPF
jgi:hypothetical protein